MTCKIANYLVTTGLLLSGLICSAQQTTAVRMNASVLKTMQEWGLTGNPNIKSAQAFTGAIRKPVGTLAEGLKGSPERKQSSVATVDSLTSALTIRESRAAQFAPVVEGAHANKRLSELASKAHAADLTFDPRAQLTNPLDGAILSTSQKFSWAAGSGASDYYLWVGSCHDCTDLLNENEALSLSRTVSLPSDGRLLYATLFSYISGYWYYVDYEFIASSGPTPAFLVSPTNGAALDNPQTFTWTAGAGNSEYYLWLGSCLNCNDLLNEDQGTKLTRTVVLPLDGRTIFATLFSYSNGAWYWVDYQFRAGKGDPVRVYVTNDLSYPVNIYINGISAGSVNPFQTQYADAVVTSMTVSFQLAAPVLSGRALGDNFAGYFSNIANASGNYYFQIINKIGTSFYFMPEVTNVTNVALEMAVNGGLSAENKCNCVVNPFEASAGFGYYNLYSNSNVRGFLNGWNYTGPYIYWGQDANGNIAPSGLLYQLAAANSGIVKLTAASAP